MTFIVSILRRIAAILAPNRVRDPRPRPEYYDGSENPDLRPPNRYGRGQHATPAPPGGGAI